MLINQANTNYTLVILDDQQEIIDHVSSMIKELYTNVDIVSFTNYEEFFKQKDTLVYNLVLADVFFGDVVSIDNYKSITKNGVIPLIYMSGNSQSSFDVYETPHIYFLPKPVEQNMLKKAIDKALDTNSFITITFWKKQMNINTEEIIYIESCKRVLSVVTIDNVYETYAKLDELATQLPSYFVRVSKSYFVNKRYIIERTSDTVVMKNGERIPIARSKRGIII